MSNVDTDTITVSVADEEQGPPYGVLPVSPVFSLYMPNAVPKFGPTIKTTSREPISKNLQRLKGKTTDLDSGVTIQADVDMDLLARMLPPTLFSVFQGPGGLTDGDVYRPADVATVAGYTVASGGALAAGVLIWASGFAKPENNGLKIVTAGSDATHIKAAGLVAEAGITDQQNATVAVCGLQAAATDLAIDADGNLTSGGGAGPHINFTLLGLTDGQFIGIGGPDAGTFFTNPLNYGVARIAKEGIAAAKLTLEKKATAFAADAGALKTIRIFFGRFITNVARDDARWLRQTLTVEATLPDLGGVGTDEYWYAKGNMVDQGNLDLPITNKGGMEFVMVGTDTPPPTVTRATNADEAREPVQSGSFSTTSELARLRVTQLDESGITTDFTSAKLNMKNNVTPKKVLGTLGAKYLNRGFLNVDLDAQVLFTSGDVADAVRNNTTVTADFGCRNSDGAAFYVDLPSVTISDGSPSMPAHAQVELKIKLEAFRDTTFGYTVSFSLFPYLPDYSVAP